MQIRCPHCQNGVEVVDESDLQSVDCPSCGSQFGLVDVDQENIGTLDHIGNVAIGHFQLINEVGRGAFGSVWQAHDSKLDRKVAVKVPRPGQFSTSSREQFLREARAAAQLSHPNIVTVYEVGLDDDRIYIVSDFIDGVSLADLLSAKRLSPLQAIGLCLKVVMALEHAHENGVIHRDLKPANIMLGENNEPFVMDFGLAKRDAGEITMTLDGKLLGTPAYMPPEQARGEGHHVDRRADVYSVGVILYEILAGELPFRGTTRMLLHQVMHEDAASPRKLNNSIPRDLETITLKCLQKEPSKRYESCAALAEDLQAWLDHKPIKARPITWMERSWRWCRRKPAVATMGAATLLILVGATVVSTIFAVAATREAEKARIAEIDATRNYNDAVESRKVAETNFQAAQQAVDEYLLMVGESLLLNQPEMEPLRVQLLEKARNYYLEFLKQRTDDPALRKRMGLANSQVAFILVKLGKEAEALDRYQQGLLVFRQLSAELPQTLSYASLEATVHNNLGNLYSDLGEVELAVTEISEAIRIHKQLVETDPGEPEYTVGLAMSYHNLGNQLLAKSQLADAARLQTLAVELLETAVRKHPDEPAYKSLLATAYNGLNLTWSKAGDAKKQKESLTKSVSIREDLVRQHADVVQYRRELAEGYNNLGVFRQKYSQLNDAKAAFNLAITTYRGLTEDHPGVPVYAEGLGVAYSNLGTLLRQINEPTKALLAYEQALVTRQSLVQKNPDIPVFSIDLAATYSNLGILFRSTDRFDDSLQAYRRGIEILEQVVTNHPSFPDSKLVLAKSYNNLGLVLGSRTRFTEAGSTYEKAGEICEQLVTQYPQVPEYTELSAMIYQNRGSLLFSTKQPQEALAAFYMGARIREGLLENYPGSTAYANALVGSYINIGNVFSSQKQLDQAATYYRNAIKVCAPLVREFPAHPEHRVLLAHAHKSLGSTVGLLGQGNEATDQYNQAISLLEDLMQEFPQVTRYWMALSDANLSAGINADNLARYVDATAYYQRHLELLASLRKQGKPTGKSDEHIEQIQRFLTRAQDGQEALADLDVLTGNPPLRAAQLLLMRSRILFRRGDHLGVAVAGEKLAGLPLPDDNPGAKALNFYNAACLLCFSSVLAAEDMTLPESMRTNQTRQYADEAFSLLRMAAAERFFDAPENLALLKKDTDLDPLRERGDFKQFMKELEASGTEPDEPATDD